MVSGAMECGQCRQGIRQIKEHETGRERQLKLEMQLLLHRKAAARL